jgi:hypothetical protein
MWCRWIDPEMFNIMIEYLGIIREKFVKDIGSK